MLSVHNTKTSLALGALFGITLFSGLNLLSYFENEPRLPLTIKTGVFKAVKIGKGMDFFFVGSGATGRCYSNICKNKARSTTETDLVVIELDMDGKIFSAKNKARDEVLFSYEDTMYQISGHLHKTIGGSFVCLLIAFFLILNRKKNVKY